MTHGLRHFNLASFDHLVCICKCRRVSKCVENNNTESEEAIYVHFQNNIYIIKILKIWTRQHIYKFLEEKILMKNRTFYVTGYMKNFWILVREMSGVYPDFGSHQTNDLRLRPPAHIQQLIQNVGDQVDHKVELELIEMGDMKIKAIRRNFRRSLTCHNCHGPWVISF